MKEFLKSNYQFTNYQIAQLEYFFKTVFSELSKIIIMGILFHRDFVTYLVALLALCLLRTSTGGLHCKTYLRCLAASITYMFLALKLLPLIPITFMLQIIGMILCIPVNYFIGPVTSDVHGPLSETVIKKSKIKSALFIFLFTVIMIIVPENQHFVSVFWITIIHTLQLIIAKIRKMKKGGESA